MRRKRQEGSSLVELALVAPLFVGLILWSNYLFDVSTARIKQLEVTRFLGWEMSAHPLSDLRGTRHEQYFERARSAALEETTRRYAGLSGHSYRQRSRGLVTSASLVEEGLSLAPMGLAANGSIELPGGTTQQAFHRVAAIVGSAQEPVLRRYGFNVDHLGARATVAIQLENRMLPTRFFDGAARSFFPERFDKLSLAPSTMALRIDTWAVPDGRDVALPGYSAKEETLFWKQVDRIALFGLGTELHKKVGSAGKILDWFPIKTKAQLVSQRYGDLSGDASPLKGCSSNELAASGKWRNGDPGTGTPADKMSKVKCFDTLPIDANSLGKGYQGDPTFRSLKSRGNHYLGCSVPGAAGGASCDR